MPKSTIPGVGERGNVAIIAGVAVMAVALVGMGVMMAVMMANHGGMMGGWWRSNGGADHTPVVATANEVTVDIRDFVYVPADVTVNAGTRVTWVTHDSAPHTATGTSSLGHRPPGPQRAAWSSGAGRALCICTNMRPCHRHNGPRPGNDLLSGGQRSASASAGQGPSLRAKAAPDNSNSLEPSS
jgi:plastocyanin